MNDVKPGYVVVLAQQLRDGASVTIQFNMALNAEATSWNAELDKLTAVLGRQEARASLDARYNERKHQLLTKEVIEQDIADMEKRLAGINEAGRDGNRRNPVNTQQLSSNIEAQRGALAKTIRTLEEIDKIIAETEKKAA